MFDIVQTCVELDRIEHCFVYSVMSGANKNTVKKVSTAESWRELLDTMSAKKHASGVDYRSAVIRQLLKAAASGKEWAVRYVLDQQLGKAMQFQRTDITSGGESLSASVNFVGNTLNSGAEQPLKAIDPIVDQVIEGPQESPSD